MNTALLQVHLDLKSAETPSFHRLTDPRVTHQQLSRLTPLNSAYIEAVNLYTWEELKRDNDIYGDQTTGTLFPKNRTAVAHIISRAEGILAGAQELNYFSKQFLMPRLQCTLAMQKHDGDGVERGDVLCELKGSLVGMLMAERTILNLLGRMSGVATATALTVKRLESLEAPPLVTATRKTLWGLLDKRAVGVGGGGTHRLNLADAILVKDTHLDPLGRDIASTIRRFFERRSQSFHAVSFFEIEVKSQHEACSAAATFHALRSQEMLTLPCYILLDNMSSEQVQDTCFELLNKNLAAGIGLEVSGGITEKNILSYARTGVDVISIGALTHSASSLDISMKVL